MRLTGICSFGARAVASVAASEGTVWPQPGEVQRVGISVYPDDVRELKGQ